MANVLIIDQDSHLTGLLKTYLSNQGCKVFSVSRGSEALVQAQKVKPDLIIMDAIMPDATGFQMCNRFRQNEATQAVPIIMMSTLAHFPNQQQYAFERGANEFVSKPLKMFELGELVDKYTSFTPGHEKPAPAPAPEAGAPTEIKQITPFTLAKPVVNLEISPTLPKPQTKYTISTDIHKQFSEWLSKALDQDNRKDR